MSEIGKLISTDDYKKAATKWRGALLQIPAESLGNILPYVTVRRGIRYKEAVGTLRTQAQFAPYKSRMESGLDANLTWRELETFLGAVDYKFDPNSAATQIIGQNAATKGDGLKSAEIAKQVLVSLAKQLSEHLYDVLWSAKRNPAGTTTADLFNGWDTITDKEITEGNITEEKGNFQQLEAITSTNAVDVLKAAYRKLNKHLKGRKSVMYVPFEVAEAYDDAYALLHNATPYNTQFHQRFVEGSNGLCEIVPFSNKADSKYIHVSTKENMLIGVDGMGDEERIEVERHEAFVLDFIATMFFGVEFESIDPWALCVLRLADAEAGNKADDKTESGTQGAGTQEAGTEDTDPNAGGNGE